MNQNIDSIFWLWYGHRMKECRVCKKSKPLTEFSKRKASKDGVRTLCKPCACDYNKRWYYGGKNKDKVVERNRQRIAKNQEWLLDFLENSACAQ